MSIERGLRGFLKQVGYFIGFFKLCVSEKTFILGSANAGLKSPTRRRFLYLDYVRNVRNACNV